MTDPVLVQVRHSSGDVGAEGKPEAPVERDLLVEQHVVQASFGAVLRYYGNVGRLDAASDELAQVGVIELPAGRAERRVEHVRDDLEHVDVCVSPDLFDLLSDGLGQRESLGLDPLDGHRSAVAAAQTRISSGYECVCGCVKQDTHRLLTRSQCR